MNFTSETIFLRLAEPGDANFILSLRTDKRYNQHLSKVEDNVTKQKKWLEDYKQKEKNGDEYYYIIHRNSDSTPIGTVRIYDFHKKENSFSWGSWILNENKTKYAALETAILIYDFAFFELKYTKCHMDMRKANAKVISFHKRFGVTIIGETGNDLLGNYCVDDYLKARDDIKGVITKHNHREGYLITINTLTRLVRDFQADQHDGFVSNDEAWIENYLKDKNE